MLYYRQLIRKILNEGTQRSDRTGVGTLALFGEMLSFNMAAGFPLLTSRKMHFNNVTAELAGFLEGASRVSRFQELGTNIWNANAEAWGHEGYMGRIYGVQWRQWDKEIDQLKEVVDEIIRNPFSRRHLVTAWNPSDISNSCLPPCHTHFQFFVDGNKLSMIFYMRSVDVFLGMPHDIALYALLLHIVAKQTKLTPHILKGMFADTHIYLNHIDQCLTMLEREPYALPRLYLPSDVSIDNFKPDDAQLAEYKHHAAIRASMAV